MHSILENPKKRVPLKNATTEQVIRIISDPDLNPNIEKIRLLRSYDRSDTRCDKLKVSLVCFTPNASFSQYVDTDNVSSASGLVYVDLDAKKEFNPEKEMDSLKKNPHVRAAWTSVSGTGIGCLIRADWSCVSNFKLAFGQALTSLEHYGTSLNYIDKSCSDITRVNLISYSDHVCANEKALSLPEPKGIISIPILQKRCNAANATLLEQPTAGRIKYKTEIDDWKTDETVRFIPEGKDYIRLYVGNKICARGERNSRLFQIGCTIMTLNTELNLSQLSKHLWAVNTRLCEVPLSPREINKMAESLFQKASKGGVYAPSKKKKIWFNPNSKYSPNQKQSISAKIVAKEKVKKTMGKLEEGLKRLTQNHPKVTQKMLALETGKSLGTIKRYWNRLKNLSND